MRTVLSLSQRLRSACMIGVAGLALGCLTHAHSPQIVPSAIPAADLPSGMVRVEIVEGIPDQTSWLFDYPLPSETYVEPAFGFVVLPTRYNDSGVKVDRSAPFVLRASARITLTPGAHQLLLRARTGSRLWIDGELVLGTPFPDLNADGHEEVPPQPVALAPDIRYLRPGHFESLTNFLTDGRGHVVMLEAMLGSKSRRPEPGELSVSIADMTHPAFELLAPELHVALTESGWDAYDRERREHWRAEDRRRREEAGAGEAGYWAWRHALAREWIVRTGRDRSAAAGRGAVAGEAAPKRAVDDFIESKLATAGVSPAPLLDDYGFLRRLSLDVIGTVPAADDVEGFMKDQRPDRREKWIERYLGDTGWADHWVSYWQDVLAENPGILKPMLNNTGPFRWWMHESFADNKPMDRFVTELIRMEGSVYYGGPAGFGLATDNDVPMAQKAQIVVQAFLGMQMQCARCHDAPYHDFKQRDLFSLAAMLRREPQLVPASSSIPTNANIVVGRRVKVTLEPGSRVEPIWPFPKVMPEDLPDGMLRHASDSRERLAALVTAPGNSRFARVLANRVWKRYLGWGLVEPVDDWETAEPSHPELLDYLAEELVAHDYDLKHLARLILNSRTYQRQARPDGAIERKASERLFAAPVHRRMTAEQLVDSLFVAAGKKFEAEEMNMDIDGRRPVKEFNNLGRPERAWQFASLSNERDRPALAMPRAQMVADALCAFGWRESRQSAQTVRDHQPNVLQPAALANGLLTSGRIARLSDHNRLTALALEDRPIEDLIRAVSLRVLSRPPSAAELKLFGRLLSPGFEERRLGPAGSLARRSSGPPRAVSWANHLSPEATRIKLEQERAARDGDVPTDRLRAEWRERMEDMIWAMANSPEFLFIP